MWTCDVATALLLFNARTHQLQTKPLKTTTVRFIICINDGMDWVFLLTILGNTTNTHLQISKINSSTTHQENPPGFGTCCASYLWIIQQQYRLLCFRHNETPPGVESFTLQNGSIQLNGTRPYRSLHYAVITLLWTRRGKTGCVQFQFMPFSWRPRQAR